MKRASDALVGGILVAGYLAIVLVLFDLWPAP